MKKILCLGLALVMLFALVGCGDLLYEGVDGEAKAFKEIFTDINDNITIVDSLDSLRQMYGEHEDSCDNTYCIFCKELKKYRRAFFKNCALIVVMGATPSGGDRLALGEVKVEDNVLTVNLYTITRGITADMQSFTVFIEIDKSKIANVSEKKLIRERAGSASQAEELPYLKY